MDLGIVNNRTTLARWIKAGLFPEPIKLGPNTNAWFLVEVQKTVQKRAAERQRANQ